MDFCLYCNLLAIISISAFSNGIKITPHRRIINGKIASDYQFPYQVSIQRRVIPEWEHICGGAIIHQLYVLSAAHCSQFAKLKHRAVAGCTRYYDQTTATRQTVDVASFHTHPDYDQEDITRGNDIMVIELEKAFTITHAVRVVALPKDSDDVIRGKGIISGWGMVVWWHEVSSFHLRYTTVDILPLPQCKDLLIFEYEKAINLSDHICAVSELNEITCSGDSGGPLVQKIDNNDVSLDAVQYTLYGILSWGPKPCMWPGVDVLVDVRIYLDWMKGIIGH